MQFNKTGSLDMFRVIAAFLVIAIHTSPLYSINETADFILTRIVGRVAVPFFMMVTGYFLYQAIQNKDRSYIRSSVIKISTIYGLSILLFLPVNYYSGYFQDTFSWNKLVKDILFDGTFYHLWYLPAMIVGILIVTFGIQRFGLRASWVGAIVLYGIGLLGDSYYGLVQTTNSLATFYESIFTIVDYTRNGLFFAPIFLILGITIAKTNLSYSMKHILIGLFSSGSLFIMEGLLLHSHSWQRHDSMYILLVPCMYYLFLLLRKLPGKSSKTLRNLSLFLYLIHPWIIILVRGFAKVMNQEQLLIYHSLIHYLVVCGVSLLVSIILVLLFSNTKKENHVSPDSRAWIEIDLGALRHNVKELNQTLPSQCDLMAVVKANAYGHGDVIIARELMRTGIKAFAVATISEGIRLRQNGIKGDILILGYTNPKDFSYLVKYKLIQTVVDYAYAKLLNDYPKMITVHIKIDTGMHRLGIPVENRIEIEKIFHCANIKVAGVFTHLSTSDRLLDEDIQYSKQQIQQFYQLIDSLKENGYQPGKLHIQSSYGILNYPDLTCDYARAGIALYGVLSTPGRTGTPIHLKPVLSLMARIAVIREIDSGEVIGYGRQYQTKSKMTIATVTIGYADGIPRHLSENDAYVLLHSKKAPIIGRICMDQLIIDVSHINEVKQNDIVTIIGTDGDKQIRCEEIADKCGTITNEILSRLGERLEYQYKDKL
ncbi:serine racemase VanT catalytic subunit [Ornithinibacillus sp. BX22]|uniref:Alanine racemase n=1 Tax=Ornithinibacillus hominis TaxID=2763055 RepID=A0A923L4B5_9BACI|nr:serine racemase VanT catalytic subunit [Ornithinibacillus hominis]MBC5636227.1 serine racemase VanT catalytic subunit [Ornithinibacillus hominis]